jgi:uncharacterized SAM-binding protein YcdF (DUF218 family)
MMSAYHPYHGGQRRWLKLVVTVVLLAVLAFCGLEAAVIIGDHSQVSGEPGVMVILGAKVEASGGPSALLQDRLDTALEYLADHPDLTIVVSGGQGSNEPVSEAQCMRDYLASHGISEDQILMEDQSHNTWQNLNFTFTLLREQGQGGEMGQVLVVSNGFHLTRARMLFGRVWEGTYTLSTLAAPSTNLPAAIKDYLREPLALVKSFVVDR